MHRLCCDLCVLPVDQIMRECQKMLMFAIVYQKFIACGA